ncbi:hypothetical protein [Candidatus Phytoplasma solani]|uniref:hypothetical protein n=1 Tax=Candidatus Phytoplasma solani TaxID=69896 RepID=UPI00358E06C0
MQFDKSLVVTVLSFLGIGVIGFMVAIKLDWVSLDKEKINDTVGKTVLNDQQKNNNEEKINDTAEKTVLNDQQKKNNK